MDFLFTFVLLPAVVLVIIGYWIRKSLKNHAEKAKAEETPLSRARRIIARHIKTLPEKALQKKINLTGRNGEKGEHSLADFKRMPGLVNFLTKDDIIDQFPRALRKNRFT